MIPRWTTTSSLPAGSPLVWTGRRTGLLADGLDEWRCSRVELYRRLDAAPELIVVDALSFPWDALRPQDRDIPLVVVLPAELNAEDMSLVLGGALLRHVTPFDRLVEARPAVRDAVARAYRLSPDIWLDVDGPELSDVLGALQYHGRRGLVEVTTDLGQFLVPEGDLITEQLREFGAHQRGDLNALVSILEDNDIVIDIGAHVGTFAIPIAAHLSPKGRVVAIEAHPDTYRLLSRNIAISGARGSLEANLVLLSAPESLPRLPVMHAGNTGGTWFQTASVAAGETITPTSLDSWLEARADLLPPTIIKIDVEGAELDVLRGAERTIAAHRPLLMVEVSHGQLERYGVSVQHLDEWFGSHDYDLFVSTGTRNTTESDYRITRLPSLVGYDQRVFDIIAVPRESERQPEGT